VIPFAINYKPARDCISPYRTITLTLQPLSVKFLKKKSSKALKTTAVDHRHCRLKELAQISTCVMYLILPETTVILGLHFCRW